MKDENPPAFPRPESMNRIDRVPAQNGMTLRDYFAAKAMQALVSSPAMIAQLGTTDDLARSAYGLANIMLKVRAE